MSCILITHPDCLDHQPAAGHPERPERLSYLLDHLRESGMLADLDTRTAHPANRTELERVHSTALVDALFDASPRTGLIALDPDTQMSPGSLDAALLAAGAVNDAVELVLARSNGRAFCAIRPPGHHAERATAMGFCLFNSIAVGAASALRHVGVERVAILDFDVHHGNGSVDIFKDTPEVLVCSSFQHPFYPGRLHDVSRPNIVNTPLPAGTGGHAFRRAIERDWLPALERHQPDLILVSAGFDGHRDDPIGGFELDDDDFAWVSELIVAEASSHCDGRIVSVLEGGYDLSALARATARHLDVLNR
ncbi:MAG: histone deacetylase family protein [Gammaproteobacteria bacterium]|nr:MAG: histone deacetylase family protein [Gammaproteobacteria bacterium]